MAGPSSVLGFGSGLARGFANAYMANKAQQRQDVRDAEDRKTKEFQYLFPVRLKMAEETGDFKGLQDWMTIYSPELEKEAKKAGAGPFDHIAPILSQGTPETPDQALMRGEQSSAITAGTGEQPELPSRSLPVQSRQPNPKAFFFGQEMPSEEEKAERASAIEIEKLKRTRLGQMDLARRMLPELKKDDPSITLEDALRYVSKGELVTPTGMAAFQSIPGEMSNGDPAFGVLDRASGMYLDPITREPLIGFRPRTTTASTSLGTIVERAAKDLGYANATAAFKAGASAQVQAKVEELRQADALASGRGTGLARVETELKMPIGPTAAGLYNVPPTTTLQDLRTRVTLRPDQQEKIVSLAQVDDLLKQIDETLPLVYPDVEPGIWGRLTTQFSLGAQTLAADEDLAKLDAAINASLAQVAQLSGQPGSRLSDRDVALAQSTLAELTPRVFGGDTLRTARARLGVLQRLLDKAKAGVPAPAMTTGAPPTTGGRPGQPYQDAQGNWVIP
jgi:hypothetical protein